MAERHASQVPQDVENIQAQVAQLRSTLRELGQILLEWGQRGVDDTRQELQAHAQDLGDTINDTVEGARKRSSQVVGEALGQTIEAAQTQGRQIGDAIGNPPDAAPRAATLPTIAAGVGVLLLLVSGVSWAAKRFSR